MGINIIQGAIGTGKSKICMEQISNIHSGNPMDKCIMLVPNHYSYITEKKFVKHFGGTGLNNIEVVTLRKLAITLLDKSSLNYITAAGRHMLIFRAIEDHCANIPEGADIRLIMSMKKPGFTDVMSSLIGEFKRYLITPEMIFEKADNLNNNDTLKNKLLSAADIYKRYNEYIDKSDYTDSEDDNIRLSKRILEGDEINPNTHIWIDSFDEFSPQQMEVIRAMAKKGADITISVCYPSDNNNLYREMMGTMLKIEELCMQFGYGEITDAGCEFKSKKAPEIKFLLENWNSSEKSYEKNTDKIFCLTARDMYSEIEKVACKISDLIREDKIRYRDIAILCGDAKNYNHIIETVFSEYRIPYFTDSTIALSDHPIAMQILSVFDIFENDWSYESVFRYLKSGFIYSKREADGKIKLLPLNPGDIDRLENYVLKTGVRGKNKWCDENVWHKMSQDITETAFARIEDEEDESIDKLRCEIAKPLVALYQKIKGNKNAHDFAKALFEFLCEINLNSGLKSEVRRMRDEGLINEAEQFTKLWNLLIDVLNQTTVALGEEKISFKKFGEYIKTGLTQCEIRTIPSGVDQVYVGNVEKSSVTDVYAMFIVGANDGTFPGEIVTEGFFSNADRNTMSSDCGINIAPDTKKKLNKQYFKVYRAICSVSDRLYISRPVFDISGNSLMPSGMIADIERVVPGINIITETEWSKGREKMYISTPEATIHRMLRNKSVRNRDSLDPVWDAAYKWYSEQDEWKDFISLIDRAKWYMSGDVELDRELAQKLYNKKNRYSASRLNVFSQCPFEYFLKYGIKAREREEWDITPADVGSYAHEVIRCFCEEVEKDAKTDSEKLERWKNLKQPERIEILDNIIDKTCENMLEYGTRDKEKTASVLRRTGKNIKNAAELVHRTLAGGKYTQKGMEYAFELPISEDISINGIIDRVDTYSDDEETRIRIIDYKTGKTEFDISNIAGGIDMQMVIYAIAAKEMERSESDKSVRVTGIYYNKVHHNMISAGIADEDDAIFQKLDKSLRLDGVTFAKNPDDIYDEDEKMRDLGESEFLNIEYYKNGKLKNKNSLRSDYEIEGLMQFVSDKIKAIDLGIKNGDISCTPYKYNESFSVCEYCAYTEVCAFSNEKCYRKKVKDDEGAWAKMQNLGIKYRGGEE